MINENFEEDKIFDDFIEEEEEVDDLDLKRLNNVTDYYSSEEQIFSPVCTRKEKRISIEEGPEPEFLEPTKKLMPLEEGVEPEEVFQGNFGNGHVGPTSLDLDPFFTPDQHDFLLAASDSGEDLNLQKLEVVNEVRVMGMRGPMMLSGWAHTLAGRRVPEGDDFATDRTKWKTGPVDLKWDEERKVYSSGMDFLEGKLKTPITPAVAGPTVFELYISRCTDTDLEQNNEDSPIRTIEPTGEIVKCVNRSPIIKASEGAYAIVARINYEYRPIWVDC